MKPYSVVRVSFYVVCALFVFATVAYATGADQGGDQQTPTNLPPTNEHACNVSAPSLVTGLTLLPSSNVMPGTDVTVRVDGYGCCLVVLETNGASDVDGGILGDYDLGNGPFPKSQTFTANTIGNFQIAILAVNSSGKSCLENEAFALNTTLHVGQKIEMPEMKPKKKLPIPEVKAQPAPKR